MPPLGKTFLELDLELKKYLIGQKLIKWRKKNGIKRDDVS